MNSLYTEDFEKKRSCIGGKTAMFNRDKEKKFFKAESIGMKTTKQVDFTGEQVPYNRVKEKRPATSYGPFISSTSYGHTFQGWGASGKVPTLLPKNNLQSSTNMPFRASSAYRETYQNGQDPMAAGAGGGSRGSQGGRNASVGANADAMKAKDPSQVYGGKNRAQKSQISILSSPGKNTPFMKDTTYRKEFASGRQIEKSKPIRHPDNLGNTNLKVDAKVYNTDYRNNFNDYSKAGACKREYERVEIRKERKLEG